MKTKKILISVLILFLILTGFALFQYFYDGNPEMVSENHGFEILAHRGLHTNWKKGSYDIATGCEAINIYAPTVEYIENTIESIQAAYDLGATIVEIDIRKTLDNKLVVFHDFDLECRTNGTGLVSENTLEYLKSLDIGYAYTPDNCQTFPFRGQGIGKMPELDEVLSAFPDKKILINQKDGDLYCTEILVNILRDLPEQQQKLLFFWGPDESYAYIQKELPLFKRLFLTKKEMKDIFIRYLLSFGMIDFPDNINGYTLGFPAKYTKFLWGFPYRFISKVEKAGANIYLIVDSEEDAQKYKDLPVHGIVTDYIEIIGPVYQEMMLSNK